MKLEHLWLLSPEMRDFPTSLNLFTSRWHSGTSHVAINDRSGAGVSGHGCLSRQEVDTKAEVSLCSSVLYRLIV